MRTLILFVSIALLAACAGVSVPACGGVSPVPGLVLTPGAELTLQADTAYGSFSVVGETCAPTEACEARICFRAFGQEACLERPRPALASDSSDAVDDEAGEEAVADWEEDTEDATDPAEGSEEAPEVEEVEEG